MERDVGGLSHGQVIEQLVLNRLDNPCPLLYFEDWAEFRGILELFKIPPDKLNDDRVGRALDAIYPYIDDIEEAVVLQVLSRFSKIDTGQILWDLTSFYFEEAYDESELIRLGYSRDQKPDKKQAVVELNVTARKGIPLAHRLLPGNASDQKEALKNLKTLAQRLRKKDFLLIGDRALLSRPNLAALIGKETNFLGPLAVKDKEFILSFPDSEYRPLVYATAKGKGGYTGVDASYTFNHNGGYYTCRAVVVRSEERYEQQSKTLDKDLKKIDAGLQKIKKSLNVRRYKNPDFVIDQAKKVLDSNSRVGKLFHVVLDGEDGALTLRWEYESDLMER